MTDVTYRLQIMAGPRVGQEIVLSGPRLTIGRYPLAEIVLDDPRVAYRHAVLTHTGDTYRLTDLNSAGGTTVNGARVGAEPVALRPGDLIVLGEGVSLLFLDDSPQAAPEEPPPVVETEEPAVAAEDAPDDAADEVEAPATPPEGGLSEWFEEAESQPATSWVDGGFADETVGRPVQAVERRRRDRRLWWLAAGCLALVLLCACCGFATFMYFIGGDWLLRQLGYLP